MPVSGRNMPKTSWPDYAENAVAGMCREVTKAERDGASTLAMEELARQAQDQRLAYE